MFSALVNGKVKEEEMLINYPDNININGEFSLLVSHIIFIEEILLVSLESVQIFNLYICIAP